jgi:hypothetical protein
MNTKATTEKNRLTKNELAYIDECGLGGSIVDDHSYVQLKIDKKKHVPTTKLYDFEVSYYDL